MNQRFVVLRELGEQFERLSADAPARGVRRRVRPRLLAPLLVALLAMSGAGVAVSLSGGRGTPVRLAGGATLCPPTHPFLAMSGSNLVYPPNYPQTSLPGRGAVSCFATAQDALTAGYKLAATPAGDSRLGSLYVAPAPAEVRRTCAAAVKLTGAPVYCPTRLPAPWIRPDLNSDCPTHACMAPLLSLSGSFNAPEAYTGSAPGSGDVTVWAASARAQRQYPWLVGCLGQPKRLVGHSSFRGHPAVWYECTMFDDGPSSMLVWHVGDESYGVSADGPPQARQRVVEYIAAHLVVQRPAG